MDKKLIIALLVIAVAAAALLYAGSRDGAEVAAVTNFEECAAAGYPVMESYPEQCKTPDGRVFVRQLDEGAEPGGPAVPGEAEAPVRNVSVASGSTVKSPLVVTGEARGNWYFEANLPVKLTDGAGNILAQAGAQAEGEWMTTEYVPFRAELKYTEPLSTISGFLVIEKDNPSGLPENAGEIRIPVRIAAGTGPRVSEGACYVGGCSGQICSDQKDALSTCEFRPEYSCYKASFAKCERQAAGQCGWTESAELRSCLANPPALE